jgi:hypothetical protein
MLKGQKLQPQQSLALSSLALLFVLSSCFSAETMGGNGGDGSRTDLKTDGGPLCTNERFFYDWVMTCVD